MFRFLFFAASLLAGCGAPAALCATDNGGCDSNADCQMLGGIVDCTCREGFEGNGRTCVPLPPPDCATGGVVCDSRAACIRVADSFACVCEEGFAGSGLECTDIDECAANPCDGGAGCFNGVGDFLCCDSGFERDGSVCVDVDECADDVCEPTESCVNRPGTFVCCAAGLAWDGTACIDVDECAAPAACPANATCSNSVGSFECTCVAGYERSGADCIDIDECVSLTHECLATARCENSAGGYECACAAGYVPRGRGCVPGFVSIGRAYERTCAVRIDGTLWCAGYRESINSLNYYDSTYRRMGTGSDWVRLESGSELATRVDGSTWALFTNDVFAPLELVPGARWKQVQGQHRAACGVLESGELWSAGWPPLVSTTGALDPVRIGSASDWTKVSLTEAGSSACGLRGSGGLWCWGDNQSAQLGLGHHATVTAPTRVGTEIYRDVQMGFSGHACAIAGDGSLWCWGSRVGLGATGSVTWAPRQVGTETAWTSLALGDSHTCALRDDGTVWCLGQAGQGQLGTDLPVATDWTLKQAILPGPATSIIASQFGTCALLVDHRVACWGSTRDLGLGLEAFEERHVRIPVDAHFESLAPYHFRATGGVLWQWGRNTGLVTQQLGRPVPLGTIADWIDFGGDDGGGCGVRTGGSLWCWGSHRTPFLATPVRVGTETNWASLSESGSCGRKTSGEVWCDIGREPWRVGTGTWRTVEGTRQRGCAVSTGGSPACWGYFLGDGTSNQSEQPVAIEGRPWSTLAIGNNVRFGLEASGRLWAWGSNWESQLGLVTVEPHSVAVPTEVGETAWRSIGPAESNLSDYVTVGLRTDGTLWRWGGPAGATPQQVDAHADWTGLSGDCAIKADGSLWCRGELPAGRKYIFKPMLVPLPD